MKRFALARATAFLTPTLLLVGAYGTQYIGGLYPCQMCMWQRWPHFAAIVIAAFAFWVKPPVMQRVLTALAAFALLTSGLIGGFHAGVEYGWWEGITSCANTAQGLGQGSGDDLLKNILNAPIIRCDVAPWDFFGISLAGFNFIISTFAAIFILFNIGKE